MDLAWLPQIAFAAAIGLVLAGIGCGLAALNAAAIGSPPTRLPKPGPALVLAAPAVLWGAFSVYLVWTLATDPGAANLWPLTVALMVALWLIYTATTWIAALAIKVFR